ncbi:hypothetical protein ASPZODRAFT_129244 [Penicilliopsis zonata CBS 506.65]|uniref:Arf-GAP domain-containing protein n=1 Tax=Penicilliopsis zonata CBS 506.65 TaxID=1073090 RepID=A0A1L9SNV6_9EURO|nr:hypothetical protein ASPZODRAFT_129244 [Penicilliopsis zonata CBS 506.65]OJJ48915.1 hypothetical protein ASPZODRAFT_129244 [Penicilliopsis zonata CBS 506.65]
MSRMWEVDPETRTKLLAISKTNGNDKCCDCGAPSPQWASPKFGTFICLNCAGIHRGLGVHISFVRSITMDAFKNAEILRMEQGGNEPWKSFYDAHPTTLTEGRTFDDSTIKERYEGEVGEEWKERLSAKVEGREYVPGQVPKRKADPVSTGNIGGGGIGSRSSTPLTGRGSPSVSGMEGGVGSNNNNGGLEGPSKKERNEAYFAKLGSENATRSDTLPPSQGGKYTGFGSGYTPSPASQQSSGGGAPAFDDFQKDPVAALSKGFGWFTSAVGRSAKTVNDTYIQPTAKTIAESDFAAQARVQASQFGQTFQAGARGAADSFNRFVEGEPDDHRSSYGPAGGRRRAEPERKDFWDDFSTIGEQEARRAAAAGGTAASSGAIGTAAMRKGGGPSVATTAGAGVSSNPSLASKGKDDGGGWDENW